MFDTVTPEGTVTRKRCIQPLPNNTGANQIMSHRNVVEFPAWKKRITNLYLANIYIFNKEHTELASYYFLQIETCRLRKKTCLINKYFGVVFHLVSEYIRQLNHAQVHTPQPETSTSISSRANLSGPATCSKQSSR